MVAITLIALFSFTRLFSGASEVDAKKFFEEDLTQSYPSADLREVLNTTKIGEGPDSYYALKARVSYGLSTPCPERIEVEYHYPARNFLKRDEKIVSGCAVCTGDSLNCHIIYPEEAVIASHTYNGTEEITQFIKTYSSAVPSVSILPEYEDEKNVWQVDWSSPKAPNTLRVLISQTNNCIISISPQGNSQ